MSTGDTVIESETEFSSALKFLTVIAQARETMDAIGKIFKKRFGIYAPNIETEVRNKSLRERDEWGRRLLDNSVGMVRVNINPEFDAQSLFRIFYSFYFQLEHNQYKMFGSQWLEVTRETPLGDPWSLEIVSFQFTETSLDNVEAKVLEVSKKFLFHAQTFNAENPLEETIFETHYPRVRELFTNTPWNKALETSGTYAHEQFCNGTSNKFADDVSNLRSELYAIKKQAKESFQ